jgi:hypothetical protein
LVWNAWKGVIIISSGRVTGAIPCPNCGTWPGLAVKSKDHAVYVTKAWYRAMGRYAGRLGFSEVLRVRDIQTRQPILWNSNQEVFEHESWVAYFHSPKPHLLLTSSTILLIDGRTGEPYYFGLANDEG